MCLHICILVIKIRECFYCFVLIISFFVPHCCSRLPFLLLSISDLKRECSMQLRKLKLYICYIYFIIVNCKMFHVLKSINCSYSTKNKIIVYKRSRIIQSFLILTLLKLIFHFCTLIAKYRIKRLCYDFCVLYFPEYVLRDLITQTCNRSVSLF